jgi:FMN phosphatase YigB (HAD superfamily)
MAAADVLAARLAARLPAAAAPDSSRVRTRRAELELEVARERVARGEDDEVDLDELLRRWIGAWMRGEPDELAREVRELRAIELDLEARAVFAAPGAAELLRHVHDDLGKRVIFVSDMYLSAAEIRALLVGAGLGRWFDAGYSSTDHGMRKATGRLFAEILRREALRPSELMFVGDHPQSDVAVPGRLGIATVAVDDPSESCAKRRVRRLHVLAERNPFWRAHLAVEAVARDRAEDGPTDPDRDIGRFLAPHFAAFALNVLERCKALSVDRVYFLAREGLFLRRLCREVARSQAAPPLPPHHYLLVSRATTFLPSLEALSAEALQRMWRQYPDQSLHALLRNLGLPAEPFLSIARSCGLGDPDAPLTDPAGAPAFTAFLRSEGTAAAFAAERNRARGLLRDHLRDRRFFEGGRVALVDIGWKGSMQESIRRAFASEPGLPEMHGLYFGFLDPGDPPQPRSHQEGFMADSRLGRPEDVDFFRTTSIHEMVTTPSHGTVARYSRDRRSGRVRAELLWHPIERENRRSHFAAAQAEILSWTRAFAHVHPLLPYSAADLRPGLLDALLRYVRYPDLAEAAQFVRYSHVESFGVEQITRFAIRNTLGAVLRSREPVGALRALRAEFRENRWREAVIRRTRVPLANALYDVWWTLRNHR